MGQAKGDMLSIALDPGMHTKFTRRWREAIPYGNSGSVEYNRIMEVAASVYKDCPEILDALGL